MTLHPALRKSFGGLTKAYYFRQLFFGAALGAFVLIMAFNSPQGMRFGMVAIVILNALLYPYARFVYESMVGFFMGENLFFVNAILMLAVKLITMVMCFAFAIVIAPIGLAYLYLSSRSA